MEHMKWTYLDMEEEVKRKKRCKGKEKSEQHWKLEVAFDWNCFEINKDFFWLAFSEFGS